MWSPATGEHDVECSDDPTVCPSKENLASIVRFEVWAEGSDGDVRLDVQSISAEPPASGSQLLLEEFSSPSHTWAENNDPVMGGRSTGTTSFRDGLLVFNGSVVDVPSLSAPGFITTQTTDRTPWKDASRCKSLSLTLKSETDYAGYRVSFGRARAACKKFFAYGYKSPFRAPVGEFGTVTIPFTDFSDCWDDATGDVITSCSDNPDFCPTTETLKDIDTISIWGEGVGGDVHLEVKNIYASDCY